MLSLFSSITGGGSICFSRSDSGLPLSYRYGWLIAIAVAYFGVLGKALIQTLSGDLGLAAGCINSAVRLYYVLSNGQNMPKIQSANYWPIKADCTQGEYLAVLWQRVNFLPELNNIWQPDLVPFADFKGTSLGNFFNSEAQIPQIYLETTSPSIAVLQRHADFAYFHPISVHNFGI